MIYLYYLTDFRYKPLELERLALSLPEAFAARVFKANSEKLRAERALAYFGLYHMMKNRMVFNTPTDEDTLALTVGEFGKPKLSGLIGDFSISHTDHTCLVAYCDEEGASLGVDIEPLNSDSEERTKRVNKRFIDSASLGWDFDISDMLSEGEISVETILVRENASTETPPLNAFRYRELDRFSTLTYTMAEALLKCDGRGFSAVGELDKIREETQLYSAIIQTLGGSALALSVAKRVSGAKK